MNGKNILAIILALLLLPSFSLIFSTSVNGSSEIQVTVPSEHTVTVICGTGGSVKVGGADYTGTNRFTVERHSDFSLFASPDTNYELVSITGSSICEMTFDGNGATLKKICKDTEFTVLFRAIEHQDDPIGILIPVTSKTGSIAAEAVIIGDGANITLDKAEFDEFLSNDSDIGTVFVDISHIGVNINTVTVPASTVRAIAKQADTDASAGMSISMPNSKITFDSAALTAIAEQTEDDVLVLQVEKIDEEQLTAVQQAAISDVADNKIIFTLTLKNGDINIGDFKGGSIDIELPYTPQENEDTETITVWYVSDDGSTEQIPCRYKDGIVSFTVFHFSDYMIVPGIIPDAAAHCFICDIFGHDIDPWCRLLPVLAACAALIIVFTLLFVTKRKKRD